MIKQLIISISLTTFSFAVDFNTFLNEVVEKNQYLNASLLEVEQSFFEGSKLVRYANPKFEIESSRFKPDGFRPDNGYRTSLTQPIRLWGVGDDRKKLADASINSVKATYLLTKAQFVRDLSLEYLKYKQNNLMVQLGDKEEKIAKEIYDISLSRFNGGAISKGRMLQSRVNYKIVHSNKEALKLEGMHIYYNLLKRAGVTKEIELDSSYKFTVVTKNIQKVNPKIELAHANADKSLATVELFDNKIEWLNVFAEFEKEPNQDIARFGLNIPLAVFNTRSEEKEVAKLEAKKFLSLKNLYEKELNLDTRRLIKEANGLQKMFVNNEDILKIDLELLKMFKESYKIANANLLELLDIQNKVITTKERLIDITIKLDANAIMQNFYKGVY